MHALDPSGGDSGPGSVPDRDSVPGLPPDDGSMTGAKIVLGAEEIRRALTHRGAYRHSREELLPLAGDWRAIAPVAAATLATLARPQWYRVFTEGAVSHYALSPAGWQQLCGAHAPSAATPARA